MPARRPEKTRSTQARPSLLDRLLDVAASPGTRTSTTAEIKESVRRDLEDLLNTRLVGEIDETRFPELRKSLLRYGLPDFSTVIMGAAEHQEAYRQTIENTIARFETRLRDVKVQVDESGRGDERTLYLRISAMLLVEPDHVPLLFDSRLHAMTREVRLQEIGHG